MKKKWSTGEIAGIILGAIAAAIILCTAFVISLIDLVDFLDKISGEGSKKVYEKSYDDYEDSKDSGDYDRNSRQDENDYRNEQDDKDSFPYNDYWDDEYYDFENAIRDDLSYQIITESYWKDDFASGEGKGMASLDLDYPVVTGDVPNIEAINQAIYEEINVVEEYVSSVAEYLSAGESYDYVGVCYVTYMSEEILSVAYVEYGYLNNSFLESYVVSMNFDVQTGMILNNTKLLDINDKFSVDFRERCERQNGEIEELSYLSDQEFTDYLTDSDCLIIFYTPLGMEVGFNYYDGWVTVTYKDFEQYKTQF